MNAARWHAAACSGRSWFGLGLLVGTAIGMAPALVWWFTVGVQVRR